MHTRPATLWEAGNRRAPAVLRLAAALLLSAAVLDLLLSERLGLFFDLVFVSLSVGLALAVRPADFFPVGVFPPLAMFGVVLLLAISRPASVARADDGVVQATVSGLSAHAIGLALGYAACLGLLAVRRQWVASHPR